MSPAHLAILGFGAIGRDLADIIHSQPDGRLSCLSVLVRAPRVEETRTTLKTHFGDSLDLNVRDNLDDILAASPDVVAECAGHAALASYGAPVLNAGVDLVAASSGALAEPEVYEVLTAAARAGGAQCVVPAGAVGAIDALGAARLSGLETVNYTGRKPPQAWKGTPAEQVADLDRLETACVFFEGTAREAARAYPKNANVAATLALAGAGMDATRVRLVADPGTAENVHEVEVVSMALEFSVRLVGKPSPANPKTSRSTVYSIARAVLNRSAAIAI